MKKIKIPAIALIAALGFSACADEGGQTVEKKGSGGVGTVSIRFDRSAANATRGDEGDSKTGTEAPANAVESEINMVEFFAFGADGTAAEEGAYFRKDITPTSPAVTTIIVDAGDMTFLVAANADIFTDADAYNAFVGDKTYNGIKAFIASLAMDNSNSQVAPDAGTGFVMTAEAEKTVVAGETNNLTMRLDRLLSKIMAPVEITGGADVSAIASDSAALDELFNSNISGGEDQLQNLNWVIDGYVVINGISNSYVFRYLGWEGWTAQTTWNWNKSVYEIGGDDLVSAYATGEMSDLFITPGNDDPVFVYENYPARSEEAPGAAIVFEQDQVTAFLIKAHFEADLQRGGTPSPDEETDPRYWRVNLLKADAWEVFRNSVYRVTINSVNTIGFATPEEAENDGPIVHPSESSISITLVVNDWDLREEGVDL